MSRNKKMGINSNIQYKDVFDERGVNKIKQKKYQNLYLLLIMCGNMETHFGN